MHFQMWNVGANSEKVNSGQKVAVYALICNPYTVLSTNFKGGSIKGDISTLRKTRGTVCNCSRERERGKKGTEAAQSIVVQ